MNNVKLLQDLRLPLFYVWLILMLYWFYKYYKSADFKNISLRHFMLASLMFFLCGYISACVFFGVQHLLLLPFMPFGISTIVRWCKLYPKVVVASLCAVPSILYIIHYLAVIKSREPILQYIVLASLWSILFICGGESFLYVLSWNIF